MRLPVARVLLVLSVAVAANAARAQAWTVVPFEGRDMLVHVPTTLPPAGTRALVIVLHGGFGNATRIASRQSEGGLNMDAVADREGFIVAYLDGTPVARDLGARMLGWNAGGGCCGQPAANDIDDVAYIRGAVDALATRYGIDRSRVFAMGHSNGAMMTQRLVCESSFVAAGVAVSGPLTVTTSCPSAPGRRILAIHGADDRNVPVAGGFGTQGFARIAWPSEAQARERFTASGGAYTLQIVAGADHAFAHLDAAVEKAEGLTIAEKSARFFGLAKGR